MFYYSEVKLYRRSIGILNSFLSQTRVGAEKRMRVGKILNERMRLTRIWFNSFDKDDWKRKTKQKQKYK